MTVSTVPWDEVLVLGQYYPLCAALCLNRVMSEGWRGTYSALLCVNVLTSNKQMQLYNDIFIVVYC